MNKILAVIFLFSLASLAIANTDNFIQQIELKKLLSQARDLDPKVLELGIAAYNKLRAEGYDQQQILTIIDYSKPSTEKRLWVIDFKHHQIAFKEWVAHGKNSGDNLATHFSDQVGSEASSIGVFLTGNTYVGHNGYSLRLNGLEQGFNGHAATRAIVIHPARYVNPLLAKAYGRIGRSWGCPAIRPEVAKSIINTIKNGTVILAYYPDQKWLQSSNFINS